MKATDAKTIRHYQTTTEDMEEWMTFEMRFTLNMEDLDLAEKALDWMNEQSQGTEAPQMDLADFFMTCITHHIHLLTEARTGRPFTLRMDRKPN